MKYEYMKEYECNGERPDGLDDDVLVDVATDNVGFDLEYNLRVSQVCWHNAKKFRIIDDRYSQSSHDPFVVEIFQTGEKVDIGKAIKETVKGVKPKLEVDWVDCPLCEGTEMRVEYEEHEGKALIQCVNHHCPSNQVGKKFNVSETQEKPKSDWFERGELPPVGEVVLGYVQDSSGTWKWLEVEILKYNSRVNNECAVHVLKHVILRWCDNFKPLRKERDELIDKLTGFNANGWVISKESAKALVDAGWRPTEQDNS